MGLIPELERSPGKDRATHSSILAWRIPWKEELGGLWSIGSHRVRHDWSNLVCIYIYMCVCVCVSIYIYMHIKLFLIIHSSYVPLHHCLHWIREYWIMVLGEMLLVTTFLSIKWCIILFNVCFYSKTSLSSLTLISLSIVL